MDMKKLLKGSLALAGVLTGVLLHIFSIPSADKYYAEKIYDLGLSCLITDNKGLNYDNELENIKLDMKQDGYSNYEIGIIKKQAMSKAADSYYNSNIPQEKSDRRERKILERKKESNGKFISGGLKENIGG